MRSLRGTGTYLGMIVLASRLQRMLISARPELPELSWGMSAVLAIVAINQQIAQNGYQGWPLD